MDSPVSSQYINRAGKGLMVSLCFPQLMELRTAGDSSPHVETDSTLNATSQFLKDAAIDLDASPVKIECEFKDGVEDAACVLVYRECGNESIMVKEYPQRKTVFPVTVTVDDEIENYTFAIFGKNVSNVDEWPIVIQDTDTEARTPPTQGSFATGSKWNLLLTTADKKKLLKPVNDCLRLRPHPLERERVW